MRTCPGYKREAHDCEEGDFYRCPTRRGGGFSRLCKECHKARGRVYFNQCYYPAHRQTLIEAVQRRRKEAAG